VGERIVEGTWNCTSCGARGILARHKSCPSCGNPREETGSESEFDFGEASASGGLLRESVEDRGALDVAAAGADWFCAYCGAANRGDQPRCRTCSATREERPQPAAAPLPLAAPPPSRWRSRLLFGCVAPLAAVVCGVCAYAFWAGRTQDYTGTVVKRSWSRTVRRETFTRVPKQGWRGELHTARAVMPLDGHGESAGLENVRDCRRMQRGTRQVPDGTERVCVTRSRSVACGTEQRCHVQKLRNGFAKEVCENVTKYCSQPYQDCSDRTRYRTVPVYDDSCTFDTWEWRPADQRTLTGAEDTPRWPELAGGALDRVLQEETYAVDLEYRRKGERRSVTLHPRGLAEFESWTLGKTANLVINNRNELKAVH
jgi:hypothetical protein